MKMRVPTAVYTGPDSKRSAFTHQLSHPIALDLVLLRDFGVEYLAWEPQTLWTEIEKTWGTTTSSQNKHRIQAIRTCHLKRSPYREWEVFENVAAGLNGVTPRFDLLQRPSAAHAAMALDTMHQLQEEVPIEEEIYRYCAAVMMDQGVAWGPGPLLPCNKVVARQVGKNLQEQVSVALAKGVTPTFGGASNDNDTQIMKSIAIKDYCAYHSRALLQQVNHLLPK